ncbi:MAG TPA: RodZ domain-containing protein [Novosphingobium sp.]|nr:RodZ domain-containing protein [Novosphingobium sp.]
MENVESQSTPDSPSTAGARLRQARKAAGLSRADIATQTKIAERHLLAIEENRFGDLAARTYAVGFSRAYARALGLDEAEIAEQVREQLDAEDHERGRMEPSFEPGDPARVPPSRMGWIAAAAVAVVVGLLLAFWGSFLSPAGKLPDLIANKQPAAPQSAAPAPVARPTQAAVAGGPVVMTATADKVWVKVTDASGKQLLQKELAQGERWTVPRDAQGPQLRTGRPDALQFTVGGRQVPALTDKPVTMSGVSLAATDLLARVPAGSGKVPVPAGATPGTPRPTPSAAAGSPAPQTTTRSPIVAPPAPSRPSATAALGARPPTTAYRQAGAAAPDPAGSYAAPPESSPNAGSRPVSTVSE